MAKAQHALNHPPRLTLNCTGAAKPGVFKWNITGRGPVTLNVIRLTANVRLPNMSLPTPNITETRWFTSLLIALACASVCGPNLLLQCGFRISAIISLAIVFVV